MRRQPVRFCPLYPFLLSISLFLIGFTGFTQEFEDKIANAEKLMPNEKIYLHFDKEIYYPGETIWFKAYLFHGVEPSGISTVLYVELVGPSGNLLQRKTLPIFESSAAGDFELPASLAISSIQIRAYTTWMRNFDSSFFFYRALAIKQNGAEMEKNTVHQNSIEFFPEGGHLVNGLPARVAFLCHDERGFPVNGKGSVTDGAGNEVVKFNTEHEGMGSFEFTPLSTQAYEAHWEDGTNRYSAKLPNVEEEGVALNMMEGKDIKGWVLHASDNIPPEWQTLKVIGLLEQRLIYKSIVHLSPGGMISGSIPTRDFPSGVLQLTVLSAQNVPLAERISFLRNDNSLFEPILHLDTVNLNPRGKNVIEIEVPDTLTTNMSLSITDALLTQSVSEGEQILSRLWLSGELRGRIDNPGYYFSHPIDSVRKDLDLVMLTHGWRKYPWEFVMGGKFDKPSWQPENYLTITGKVKDLPKKAEGGDQLINLLLLQKDSSRQLVQAKLQNDGLFSATGIIFQDTVSAYVQMDKNKEKFKYSEIHLNQVYLPPPPGLAAGLFNAGRDGALSGDLDRAGYFLNESIVSQEELKHKIKDLAPVVVKAKEKSRKQILDETYTRGIFLSKDDYWFDVVNDQSATRFADIFRYLQGRIPGLLIRGSHLNPTLEYRNYSVALFVNDQQVGVDQVTLLNTSEVAYVKFYRNAFYGGGPGISRGGALAIYTVNGSETPAWGGMDKDYLYGFSKTKVFYNPDYDSPNPLSEVKDVRSTIFWEPYILTDPENRRVTVRFFNNDISKRLLLTLEGMTIDGKLAHITRILQ